MAKMFYSMAFAGSAGWGGGMLVFDDDSGLVVGADVAGVAYDGEFKREKGRLEGRVLVTVPPGVGLVTGVPVSSQKSEFIVNLSVPMDDIASVIPVETPIGPLRVQLGLVRMAP
jgi:hypothetical protein